MKIRYFQKGFNYSQDGPGNRLVFHLQGCNLKCPWCCNPEGMEINGGIEKDVMDIIDEIKRSRRLFFDNGGVTFTGGEPTLQKKALIEILKACKAKNIHTCIETNGSCAYDSELFNLIDLVIVDFKHFDEKKLLQVVGENPSYKKNISDYIKSGQSLLIRTVLIHNFNDDDVNGFVSFFKQFKLDNVRFEFLKYHEFGKNKWLRLNKTYLMEDAFVTDECLNRFEQAYRDAGFKGVRT